MEYQTSHLGIVIGCLIVGLIITNLILIFAAIIRGSTAAILMSAIVCFINLVGAGIGAFGPTDGPEGGEAAGRGVCGAYFFLCLVPQLILIAVLVRRMCAATQNTQTPHSE